MTREESDCLTFCRNILIGVKREWDNYPKGIEFLDKQEPHNDFERAFIAGARDYLAFVNDVPFEVDKRYILPEKTYMPGVLESAKFHKDRDVLKEQDELAIGEWLAYNVVTEGCNSVC